MGLDGEDSGGIPARPRLPSTKLKSHTTHISHNSLPTRSVFPGFLPGITSSALGCPLADGAGPTRSRGLGHPKKKFPALNPFPPHPPPERRRRRLRWLHPSTRHIHEQRKQRNVHHSHTIPTWSCGSLRHLPGAVSPSSASLPGGFFLELLVFPHFFRVFVLWDREGGGGRRKEEEEGEEGGGEQALAGFQDSRIPTDSGSGGVEGTRFIPRDATDGSPASCLLPWGHFKGCWWHLGTLCPRPLATRETSTVPGSPMELGLAGIFRHYLALSASAPTEAFGEGHWAGSGCFGGSWRW